MSRYFPYIQENYITVIFCCLLVTIYIVLLFAPHSIQLEAIHHLGVHKSVGFGIISATFIHINLPHLAYNTVGIAILGSLLERHSLRKSHYLLFLIGCSSAIWLFYLIRNPNKPAVGASGLLFGLLGLFLCLISRTMLLIVLCATIIWGGIIFTNPSPNASDIHVAGLFIGCLAAIVYQKK